MELNINSEKIDNNTSINIQQRKCSIPILSSAQKYELEWKDLSGISIDTNLLRLRQVAVEGDLKISKFRSICWALLLGIFKNQSFHWVKQRRYDREQYKELKIKYCLNPHTIKNIQDDPLSQSKNSVWHQHFCDKELCGIIQQDVVRTFPGVDFYRNPDIQQIMIHVLFCYAREHPNISYRQGMHEILAPILFVLHCDQQALLHVLDMNISLENHIEEILDPNYLEEDSFFIFSKIMKNIEPFYRINNFLSSANDYFSTIQISPPVSPQEKQRKTSEVEVVAQLNFIRDKILAKEDLHLHNHLLKLDIPLPIFGIRWLRLLFGREFPLQELLIVWDAILGEGDRFELTNFIVVAMLIRIRDKLLLGDYTTCLMYLMKYPTNVDISLIIKHALHMKCPTKYSIPAGAFVYISAYKKQLNEPKNLSNNNNNKLTRKDNNSTDNFRENKSNKNYVASLKNNSNNNNNNKNNNNNNTNLNTNNILDEQTLAKMNELQNSSALATVKIATQSRLLNESEPGVIDGYLEDSPDLLKIELQNAHTVMTISRIKLNQYLMVLRKYIPPTNNSNTYDEIHQTLDGIEELCALLNHKIHVPYKVIAPVEKAFEANESGSNRKKSPSSATSTTTTTTQSVIANNNNTNNNSKNNIGEGNNSKNTINIISKTLPLQKRQRKFHISDHESKKEFVRQLPLNLNFEIQATSIDNDSGGGASTTGCTTDVDVNNIDYYNSSVTNNLRVYKTFSTDMNLNENNLRNSTRYEIPENQLTRLAEKILGNRKEFEMHEFRHKRHYQLTNSDDGDDNDDDDNSNNCNDDGGGGDGGNCDKLNNIRNYTYTSNNVMPNIDPVGERNSSPNDD